MQQLHGLVKEWMSVVFKWRNVGAVHAVKWRTHDYLDVTLINLLFYLVMKRRWNTCTCKWNSHLIWVKKGVPNIRNVFTPFSIHPNKHGYQSDVRKSRNCSCVEIAESSCMYSSSKNIFFFKKDILQGFPYPAKSLHDSQFTSSSSVVYSRTPLESSLKVNGMKGLLLFDIFWPLILLTYNTQQTKVGLKSSPN